MKHDSNKHEEIISSLKKELGELLENSSQPIYVYLDDTHKFCNEKYARMLGFSSAQEWAEIEDPVGKTVEDKSQDILISAYNKAMEQMAGSQIKVTWKKQDGSLVNTNVILTPFPFKDELLALHFIDEI